LFLIHFDCNRQVVSGSTATEPILVTIWFLILKPEWFLLIICNQDTFTSSPIVPSFSTTKETNMRMDPTALISGLSKFYLCNYVLIPPGNSGNLSKLVVPIIVLP
jgi:hypothetical protein